MCFPEAILPRACCVLELAHIFELHKKSGEKTIFHRADAVTEAIRMTTRSNHRSNEEPCFRDLLCSMTTSMYIVC